MTYLYKWNEQILSYILIPCGKKRMWKNKMAITVLDTHEDWEEKELSKTHTHLFTGPKLESVSSHPGQT